jgi:glc operon protein GlcG
MPTRQVLAALLAVALASPVSAQINPSEPSVASQPNISTAAARRLVAWSVERARRQGMRICIAVSDADGHLLAFERMQDAYAGCVDAAIAKARSAARFHIKTNDFYEMVRDRNLGIGFIPDILPAVGGVPLKHGASFVGSVGVSGDNDTTEQSLALETAAEFR